MAPFSDNKNNREFDKYRQTLSGDTAVAFVLEDFSGGISFDQIISGTTDGTLSGTERTFVNNKKAQVLAAHDLSVAYTWLDFGNKNERVSTIIYTSATFVGVIITRTFSYTLTGGKYRLDTEAWTSNVGG